MEKEIISNLLAEVEKSLHARRLLSAINALEGTLGYLKHWELSSELSDIRSGYSQLLDFMEQGVADPSRSLLFQQFLRRTHILAIRCRREAELNEGLSPYAVCHRLLKSQGNCPSLSTALAKAENEPNLLFDVVWTSEIWSAADASAAFAFLENEQAEVSYAQSLLISATTLAALSYFDSEKLSLLLSLSTDDRPHLRHRALAGCVWVCLHHRELLPLYPALEVRLSLMATDMRYASELQMLQESMLLHVKNDAPQPEMQTMEMLQKLLKNRPSLRPENTPEAIHEALSDAAREAGKDIDEIEEQIHATVRAARKGADILLPTFAATHSHLPFFRTMANWFAPFTAHHAAIPASSRQTAARLQPLLENSALCDADKYVFCLMLSQMPAEAFDSLDEDALRAAMPEESNAGLSSLSAYVMQTHRFFLLHSAAPKPSPFDTEQLVVEQCPQFSPLLSPEALLQTAHAALRRHLPAAALAALHRLPTAHLDEQIYLSIGHCQRALGRYAEAAESYRRALLHSPESHFAEAEQALAACLRAAGRYEEALTGYRHALLDEHLSPANRARLLHGAAECLLQSGAPTEALNLLFEAHYLCPESRVVLRALAWSAMMADRLDVARQQYAALLELPCATAADLLNAGHAAWLSGQPRQAAVRYRQACTENATAALFDADAPFLQQKGKTEEDLRLMAEIIERSL